MNRHLKHSLREGHISYWDKVNLGLLATTYRRSGTKGIHVCHKMIRSKQFRRCKMVKIYKNFIGYPVCDNFLFKAQPWFGYN